MLTFAEVISLPPAQIKEALAARHAAMQDELKAKIEMMRATATATNRRYSKDSERNYYLSRAAAEKATAATYAAAGKHVQAAKFSRLADALLNRAATM